MNGLESRLDRLEESMAPFRLGRLPAVRQLLSELGQVLDALAKAKEACAACLASYRGIVERCEAHPEELTRDDPKFNWNDKANSWDTNVAVWILGEMRTATPPDHVCRDALLHRLDHEGVCAPDRPCALRDG